MSLSQPFLTESSQPDEPLSCPLCGCQRIFTDIYNGEEVCVNCGCVINDPPISLGKEHQCHSYEEHEESSRHGVYITHRAYDRGFNTVIQGNKDAYGNNITKETASNMSRLRRQDNRSKIDDTAARNLNVAMTELDRITTSLHLPSSAKEYAAYVYRQALAADLIRGRSIDSFVAASIYVACRVQGIPRSLKTVISESKRDGQEVSMTYRFLLKELNIKPPVDAPQKYIPKLAAAVNVSRAVERLASDILSEAKGTSALVGKDPRGVAGAALYLALEIKGERMVQRKIAKACGTTEVTLRNRYRELKNVLGKKSKLLY